MKLNLLMLLKNINKPKNEKATTKKKLKVASKPIEKEEEELEFRNDNTISLNAETTLNLFEDLGL